MATLTLPSDTVILPGVSWEEYERLSDENPPTRGRRLTFDRGVLQIMTLSAGHEYPSAIVSQLVEAIAELLDLEVCESGSTTFRREDLEKGFEADTSFYFRNVRGMQGREVIDLTVDPPPDLVVEIDITHGTLDKLPLFAAVGVAEVWRYDGSKEALEFLRLDAGSYVSVARSGWLDPLTPEVATDLLRLRRREPKPRAWRRAVRTWFETTAQARRA